MGVISQALSGLAALTNKFYQFGDSNTVPMHVLSDLSGNAIDMSLPGEVVGNVADAASDSGKPVKIGAKYVSSPVTYTDGQRGNINIDSRGNLRAMLVGALHAAADGVSNSALVAPLWGGGSDSGPISRPLTVGGFRFNGTTWDREVKPNAVARLISAAASTNGTSVKGSAGNVFRIRGYNASAGLKYLKLYNKASAPTVGTDVPVLTLALPATAVFDFDLGGAEGHYFSTGIAYAITGAAADNDTTALTAGDVTALNITYA